MFESHAGEVFQVSFKSGLSLALILSLLATAASAQDGPHTPKAGSAERRAITDALRAPVEKELKTRVVFKVYQLKVQDGWAFLRGVPQRPNGKPVDYTRTEYKERIDLGMFDDGISALLQKKGKRWVVVKYEIGATDVSYLGWADEFHAPALIFGP